MRGPAVLFILALLFLVEFIAWLTLALWGWIIGSQWGDGIGAIGAIVAFVLVVLAWGLLASPKARVPTAVRWIAKVLILGGAVATLIATGQTTAGVAFAVVAAVTLALGESAAVKETRAMLAQPRDRA